jgi:hypothetical protein
MNRGSIIQCEIHRPEQVRHAAAWVLLCAALAVHVADEALTGFLSVYNPAVRAIRERAPFLPLPTFTFEPWLGGLIGAVTLLVALSVYALRGARWMVPLSWIFGILMFGNGLMHVLGTFYMRKAMPGVYSSPLLLAAAGNLLYRVYTQRRG